MFAQVDEALTAAEAVELDGLTDDELTEAVLQAQRLRARLEAAEARALSRWDARRCWQPDGAKSGAAWLTAKLQIPRPVAAQRVRHARGLRSLPAIAAAWASGQIDRTHVTVLLRLRTPRTAEAFARDHASLLAIARTQSFADFKKACDWWSYRADPDGAEARAAAQHAGRELNHPQSFEGAWFTRGTFDPIGGAIVDETLRAVERELFEEDWREAEQRLGRKPVSGELRRTPAQRRADALVLICQRARSAPADGRKPRPLFTVLVGYETFAGPTCELWNGTTVTPGSLLRWMSEAEIERIVFDGPSRIVDVGPRRRLFRGALRRAIEVRDRRCFHPLCDEVPEQSEIDHVLEASKGGETTQANGRVGCAFHNRRRNQHPDDWGNDEDADLSRLTHDPCRNWACSMRRPSRSSSRSCGRSAPRSWSCCAG